MVTVQDIGQQLTKPVKELAEWNYPFSQTLEKYCSLFNKTCNKSFCEAGLVVQNSAAVYMHRVDCLWNKMEYFRNVFSNDEHQEIIKSSCKKDRKFKDRKTDISFQDFKIINFAKDVDKNIDIKKNYTMQGTVKSKNRRFTQVEKSITQHVPIDIYDVNGEIIGKKYDFRCNQNISMDGILVDDFAPQDFYCNRQDLILETSYISSMNSESSYITEPLECSSSTLTMNSILHNDSNENLNSDIQSEENDDDLPEETSDLATSFESNQNLSSVRNSDTETVIDTTLDITDNNCHELNLTMNKICTNTLNDNTVINNGITSNNDSNTKYLNNIKTSIETAIPQLDTPPESTNSHERRTPITDDSLLSIDINQDLRKAQLSFDHIQNTPLKGSPRNKSRLRSTSKSTSKSSSKSTSKSNNRKSLLTPHKKGRVSKNLLNEFRSPRKKNHEHILEKLNSSRKGRNMLQENLNACLKYIRQCDALQYEHVTNVALDFLGFRLRIPEADMNMNNNNNNKNSNNNNTETIETSNMLISIDDEMSRSQCSTPINMSSLDEHFYNSWFRTDSSTFLPENVDKWHELMQPKLREAEQRSTFCIRDYRSRIMEFLHASGQQKINFDVVIKKEHACEVARYFLASLDLASRRNVDISMDKELGHNIEIALHEDNRRNLSNN